ncbi:glycosyltransferase family 2 protein [Candidatus Kuenenbacteria bacterium]|nr:glycosyltransferase family 2 protein [Candidatus Kuenenbacteria bacterium]
MKITAVVPVYNENPEKLAGVLANLKNYVDDIVVVDDGSAIAISNFQFPISNLTLLRHEINRGQGAALQTGTDFAVQNGAEIIIHFDADGQHNPEDIPILVKPIEEGRADFVFGSRYLTKNNQIPWTKKNILHPIARLVNYLLTGLNLSDAHNGLRAFSARIADKVYLSQDRMAHATEYLQLVKKNKIRYTEVAVRVNYQNYGQGLKGGLKVVRELLTGKIIKN